MTYFKLNNVTKIELCDIVYIIADMNSISKTDIIILMKEVWVFNRMSGLKKKERNLKRKEKRL